MAAEEPDSGIVTLGGARTLVTVPMLKDNELVGMIAIYRQEVRPFSEKQIELLQNFAAQAVIAIENARLLNELRQRTDELSQRTDDLSEALEQQTATSEVLRVISSSPGELEPVFQTMLENATHICEAKFGMLFRLEDGAMRPVASLGLPEPLMEFFKHGPHRPSEHAPIMRVARTKQAVHVLDFTKERAYLEGSPVAVAGVELGGIRTNLLVPLLKDNELIGAFAIYRQEVRPFADKQIDLLKNFAAQAVIAIENARLLSELRQRTTDLTESLEQQTATSDVLRVISTSPGDLEPIFQAMLANATRICEARFGTLFRFDGRFLQPVAQVGTPVELIEAQTRRGPLQATPGGLLDQVVRTKQVIHSADRAADPVPGLAAKFGGARSVVGVPMLRGGELIGAIVIYRQQVQPFTDKQIDLVQNFAAQAEFCHRQSRHCAPWPCVVHGSPTRRAQY